MNKFAYDTLGTSRELEAAGMERRQAEAVATAIARREGNLATKSDLNLLRTELKSDISKVESNVAKVESDIAKVESDIAKVESDISSLRTEVKSDISSLRTEVKSDISEVRSEMKAQFRWAISTQVIAAFAVITLVYAIVQ